MALENLKERRKTTTGCFGLVVGATLLSLGTAQSLAVPVAQSQDFHMPWREAGLSERQAAVHLLDRLAYGARPGDVDRVVAMGLDRWFLGQLAASGESSQVEQLLRQSHSLDLSAREIAQRYPAPGRVRRMAMAEGVIENPTSDGPRSSESGVPVEKIDGGDRVDPDRSTDRRKVRRWAEQQGYRPVREAMQELVSQKMARALYSDHQLTEVLTDFWFNHFNVSVTDNQARIYVWPYERDAIRPHVLGSFADMLAATAKHPAMLHYLDNARSVAGESAETTFDRRRTAAKDRRARGLGRQKPSGRQDAANRRSRRSAGLNENYARELMELHTLGVDGGYDQDDVTEVARAFTGWTTYPPDGGNRNIERRIRRAKRSGAGFVFEDAFIFRADAHDAGRKVVLGHVLSSGRGIEDGLDVLKILSSHPSTATHLSRKLAVRFVSDQPPQALVDRLAECFSRTDGDLRQMMITLVQSPEMWAQEARRAKIKSPFEAVASALRALDAEVTDVRGLYDWLRRMGQSLYGYQAPTGYPDRAEAWVNAGSLLNRMNFGLQVAAGQVPGVRLDLSALVGGQEPVSLDHALDLYLPRLLPERSPEEAARRLRGVIHDPQLADKLAAATPSEKITAPWDDREASAAGFSEPRRRRGLGRANRARLPEPDRSPQAQVVGVILGSPEFQRR